MFKFKSLAKVQIIMKTTKFEYQIISLQEHLKTKFPTFKVSKAVNFLKLTVTTDTMPMYRAFAVISDSNTTDTQLTHYQPLPSKII